MMAAVDALVWFMVTLSSTGETFSGVLIFNSLSVDCSGSFFFFLEKNPILNDIIFVLQLVICDITFILCYLTTGNSSPPTNT